MKKMKPSIKTALASTLVIASTAAIAYATPKLIESRSIERESKLKLAVEKVDGDTVKVALDNVQEIPKSLQFSIQLQGATLKDGTNSIKDLIKKESEERLKNNVYSTNSNDVLVDYTYNEKDNTIDVLITSENAIPKTSNKIEILELDVKPESVNALAANELPTYKIVPSNNYEYKYVSNTNREYISKTVDHDNESISLNMSPTIKGPGKYIELAKGEKLELTAKNLGITVEDPEGNEVTLEVKKDGALIKEFVSDKPGVYDLSCTAIDNYGDRSETITVQIFIAENKTLIIEAENKVITVGDKFEILEGVTVKDEDGNKVENANIEVKVEGQGDVSGATSVDTSKPGEYKVTYSVTNDKGAKFEKVITVTVLPKMEEINSAPVINAEDRTIIVGTEFNPLEGVTVTDKEDTDLSVNDITWEGEVDINKPGKYTVKYSVKDSKGAIGTKTITVTVVYKMEGLNSVPVISAEDKVIKLGETFNPLEGVTATDKEDGNLTNSIKYESNVDINTVGEYTVTYTVQDSKGAIGTKTIKVIVKKDIVLAESITINNKFNDLYVGGSKTLTATINNEADIKDIEWTTSDENIASIEVIGNDAKIVAKSEGKVTITAKTKDGSNKADSVTIDIIDFKNENKLPTFIKDVIDSSVVKPVSGIGEQNSPLELEVQNISIEEFDKFLKELASLQPSLVESYEEGDFTVYKIKILRKAGLFRSASEGYIELRVNNGLANANEYKASIDKLLVNSLPEQPEQPGQDENTNQNQGGNNNNTDNSGNTENEKPSTGGSKLPVTGQESILGFVSIATLAAGGFLLRKKKNKK